MFLLIISQRAKVRIAEVSDYIYEQWGQKSHRKFLSELERCLKIIEINPNSFRCNIEMQEVHECVVTYYNILYYTVKEDEILILSLEDTRMQPVNISFLLK